MELTHKNCQDSLCYLCMSQHNALGRKLDELCESGTKFDHLGRFHSWLKKNGATPETEFGWGTDAYFDDENISRYVAEFLVANAKVSRDEH